jgi:HSP20 family protein
MSNLQTIMDSFFDDVRPMVYRQASSIIYPAINLEEYNDKYLISITIPGIDSSKIKIELADKTINIGYLHEQKDINIESSIIREEYKHYSFSRTITLPRSVEPDSVAAIAKNGILNITISKSLESQPKIIKIEQN